MADNSKPDGSAYKAHMESVAERNAATQKAGRAQRAESERLRAEDRRASELRNAAGLRRSEQLHGGRAGKS